MAIKKSTFIIFGCIFLISIFANFFSIGLRWWGGKKEELIQQGMNAALNIAINAIDKDGQIALTRNKPDGKQEQIILVPKK